MSSIKTIGELGFCGPIGSNSHQAAVQAREEIEKNLGITLELKSIDGNVAVIDSLTSSEDTFIVIATWNTILGDMEDHLTKLQEVGGMPILSEIEILIEHHLMGKKERLDTQTVLLAHPKAYEQCARTVMKVFSYLKYEGRTSASGAAEEASKSDPNVVVAIAPIECSKIYGLNVYRPNIEDVWPNITKFRIYTNCKDLLK